MGGLHAYHDDDRGLKIEMVEFDGISIGLDDYLEWDRSLERYFE